MRDAIAVNVSFVAKCHRFERENSFARVARRLNLLLEPRRRRCHAKLTGAAYNYCCACNSYAINARDKRAILRSYLADADLVGVACHTDVADIDVETARGEIKAG